MHLETLPDSAREILKHLGREPLIAPFYLAGGSAVALRLGHRISVDLDFFTTQASYEAEPLTQRLGSIGKLVLQQQSQGTLVGSLSGVHRGTYP